MLSTAHNIPQSASSSSLSIFGGGAATPSVAGRPGKPSGSPNLGLNMRDVIRCHISLAFPGASSPSLLGSSIMALGHANPAHHEVRAAWASVIASFALLGQLRLWKWKGIAIFQRASSLQASGQRAV